MKKILFTPGIAAVEALGSITRLVAIADEIKNRKEDCNIIFRSAGREAEYAKASGYKVVEGFKPKLDITKVIAQGNKTSEINSVCDVMNLKGLVSKEYIQNTFKEEVKLLEDFKPDIIVGEFETVMPIVAKKMGIPYFCTGGTPNRKDFNYFGFSNKDERGFEKEYNELLNTLNLETIENIAELNQEYNSDKIFIPSIPELEDLQGEKYIFLGSVTPKNFTKLEFKFEKKKPLVYVYLSASKISPEVYEKVILDAFTNSEFEVIVTAGGNSRFKRNIDSNIENVHFMDMVPADKVMEIADISIHHGGQNTTVQCIENEVPSIIFPGNHFERYFNAEKASQIGCALNCELKNFNGEFILKSCKEIIRNDSIRKNLNKYAKKIKSYGGAKKAADFILNY